MKQKFIRAGKSNRHPGLLNQLAMRFFQVLAEAVFSRFISGLLSGSGPSLDINSRIASCQPSSILMQLKPRSKNSRSMSGA